MDQVFNHEQNNMQTDEVPHKLHAEATKSVANEKTSHDGKADTLLETSKLPEEEMMAEPSDPLRDKLSALYRRIMNNEKLQPEPDGDNVNIAYMQANMFHMCQK
ncbi:23939_t:CDS:1 [Gigaspora margarita]|uniref:23939_t:CDS:1 n=1 Tax=Gigaspora margarita TaxID=4874 RepID=A0ABN7WBB6_GIGMA|nr:23939_t:CDS:1 [Gigaspora margarita]